MAAYTIDSIAQAEQAAPPSAQQIARWAQDLEGAEPHEIIRFALEKFPDIAIATQFGVEGCSLLHRAAAMRQDLFYFCIDTGLLFKETWQLSQKLQRRLGIRVHHIEPAQSVAEQAVQHGANLWEHDPEVCCLLRKVEPMREALAGRSAWMTSIRREQSGSRQNIPVIQWDERFGLVKVSPLAAQSTQSIEAYIAEHNVPTNPLRLLGYQSVGCFPCTRPTKAGEEARSGRWWRFQDKSECGLHTLPMSVKEK